MVANLVELLVASGHGDEVPITAALAWFLERSPELRSPLLDLLDRRARTRSAALPRAADGTVTDPSVTTELVVADPRGGTCRYDLVLDWHAPTRLRLVVEVKVWAELTRRDESDEGPGATEGGGVAACSEAVTRSVHQLERYLRTAAATPAVATIFVVLAPFFLELDRATQDEPRFAGQLTWQPVRDAFGIVLRSKVLDPTMAHLARGFVRALETRQMAAPELTFDAITSVARYRRFHASLTNILEQVRARLQQEGKLDGFSTSTRSAWQDDHDRIGQRIWVVPSSPDRFAFIGVYVGEDTIHADVPDLYFFLEAAKGHPVRKALDAREGEIRTALAALDTPLVRWKFQAGGYEAIQARMSLVEVARLADPADEAYRFFAGCLDALRANGELARFLASNAGASE